ncbi:hypothetical protein Ade02nite_52770 [Paractinoplanes deccanensis]|uniref:Uncharacterized protein n=1 Tax=Paractinoplanes deccanensis TaxID=113561 RepID=A0ABQ3Y9L2_9ACTN|nr:hypothetical protein [Actinoplanes deccanensis]GID76636.1 hypothetical protein Ade02nite_52770 [Actinoplanes deccanensis]
MDDLDAGAASPCGAVSFAGWLADLAANPGAGFDLRDDTHLRRWRGTVYRENGVAAVTWAHQLMFARRTELAAVLLRGLKPRAESVVVVPLEELAVQVSEPPASRSLPFAGGDLSSGVVTVEDVAVRGLEPADMGLEAADGVHNDSAGSYREGATSSGPSSLVPAIGVWPASSGGQPRMYDGRPSWACSQGSQVVSAVFDQPGDLVVGAVTRPVS